MSPALEHVDVPAFRTVVREGRRLIARFVGEQPLAFTLAATGAVAFTSAIIASAIVIGAVVDDVIVPILAEGQPVGDRLRVAVLLILGVAVWKAVGIVIRRTTAGWVQFGAQMRLRERLLAHQLRLSMRWYGSRAVGDLLSVSDADSQKATFVLAPLPFATGVAFLIVGGSAVILATDVFLGLPAILVLFVAVAVDLRGSYVTFTMVEEEQRRKGLVAEVAHESFDGALTVKALGREAVEAERFAAAADHLADQQVAVSRIWTAYRAVTDTLPAIGTIAILVLGVIRVGTGDLTAGELIRVAYLLSLVANPVRLIGYLMWDLANSVAGWNRVAAVLSVDDVVRHGELPTIDRGTPAAVDARSVRFGYDPSVPPIVDDLHLEVPPGRTVAIVGATASGKSTLALLLARLWDPDDGSIRLDERELRDLAAGVVPTEVAYVAQESFLFDDDVRGNVTLGEPFTDAEVEAAMRLANAAGFVAALPAGTATRLGERGATLSGGQQQRLALARALIRKPRLLLLDDATSAVDPSVESVILRGLRDAELPSTVIVVAYRRSSIVLADEVVFVADGRVLAHGTHEQLLASEPGYAELLEAYERDAARRRDAHAQVLPEDDVREGGPPTEGRV